MRAMVLRRLSSLEETRSPLDFVHLPAPQPGHTDLLVRVRTCGVCHTELDEIEGRTPPPRLPVIPGHQVVGIVDSTGPGVTRFRGGERVGIGWIYSSSGDPEENISPDFKATGRDVNGGYADYMTVPEHYASPIPEVFSDEEAAPLLCAGAVGYRSLKLSGIGNGGHLGLTGFGGSGHLVLQAARHCFPDTRLYVFARSASTREFAKELGADWAGQAADSPPGPLDAIIDTTPAWTPVVEALRHLRPGGRLVINAIRKEDADKHALLKLSYHEHLWLEKEIKSVANVTHQDISEFLLLAAQIPIKPRVQIYALEDANQALLDLRRGSVQGAKVLRISGSR